MLETFVFPDLDIHALASAPENIWEYAMCEVPYLGGASVA
jgi:hypothetical protein